MGETYWHISISGVSDYKDEEPEIRAVLDISWSDDHRLIPLPRSGQKYWLIDEPTFRKLTGREAE